MLIFFGKSWYNLQLKIHQKNHEQSKLHRQRPSSSGLHARDLILHFPKAYISRTARFLNLNAQVNHQTASNYRPKPPPLETLGFVATYATAKTTSLLSWKLSAFPGFNSMGQLKRTNLILPSHDGTTLISIAPPSPHPCTSANRPSIFRPHF